MKERTCCFTGHREIEAEDALTIEKKTEAAVREKIAAGYRFFGVGGALGFDTVAAKVVLALKAEFPEVALIMVLPCRDQTKYWKKADVAVYEDILSRADKCVYTSESYFRGCMQKRNRYLVDNSSACIAYLRHDAGGTAYTVRYARAQGLSITLL